MVSNKKGIVVGQTIGAIGGVIILTIITLVIVSTVIDANLLTGGPVTITQGTTTGESGGTINTTPYQLGTFNTSRNNYVVTGAWNTTTDPINVANITVNTSGAVTNATAETFFAVNFNYTFDAFGNTIARDSTDDLAGNFTDGIDNVSEQLPTILLIVAVVFLFGALVLLITQARRMGIGQGSL